jgi:integrase
MVERLAENFKNRPLVGITFLSLEEYKAQLKNTPIRIKKRKGKVDEKIYPSTATVNRYMATLHHMLGKAVSWDMLAKNPFGNQNLLDPEESRDRYLSEEEIQNFLEHCKVQHIKDFFLIAVNTGMDKGEILNLKWEQIKEGVIYCPKVKTRPERYIYISDDLRSHLMEIKQRKIISEYVVVDR